MPVSGREIASLDFANLIGGPLDAVVRAQAKSAISTANFIKEVGFDADGKLITVDFTYTKRNERNKDQEFTLTVPFLAMLPIPYITIYDAVIDFNARITSTTTTSLVEESSAEGSFEASAKYWFFSVNVQGKTSSQKKNSYSDAEERMFEMHVRVEARNQDMPTGTDRILTMLEDSISERKGPKVLSLKVLDTDPKQGTDPASKVTALIFEGTAEQAKLIKANYTFQIRDDKGKPLTFNITNADAQAAPDTGVKAEVTVPGDPTNADLKFLIGRTVEVSLPEDAILA